MAETLQDLSLGEYSSITRLLLRDQALLQAVACIRLVRQRVRTVAICLARGSGLSPSALLPTASYLPARRRMRSTPSVRCREGSKKRPSYRCLLRRG